MTIIIPNYKWASTPGAMSRVDAIVLHHAGVSVASPESIHQSHLAQGWAGIGYHYYIRKDGAVSRGRRENWQGAHAGASSGYNTHSIGVCFEGNYEAETMPSAQLAAGRALLADITERRGALGIVCHRDLTATACPGRNFPLESLLAPEKEEDMKRYQTTEELPAWAKATIEKLIAKGYLNGNEHGLDLSEDMVRMCVINDRAGVYGE